MIRYLNIIMVGILFSMYIFPFQFAFLSVGNTKIYLALLGLCSFVLQLSQKRNFPLTQNLVMLILGALGISFFSFVSIVYNDATDIAYVSYIMSMFVWLFAAFAVCKFIGRVHGYLSVKLICFYFIAVCVAQNVFALLNEFVPLFRNIIDMYVIQESHEYLKAVERMYGIGAAFDTAGTRFACALVMLSYYMVSDIRVKTKYIYAYLSLFIFILVVGSMVARTTLAGAALAFLFLIFKAKNFYSDVNNLYSRIVMVLFTILAVLIPIVTVLLTIPEFNKLFEFAFEGFYNMASSGKWETHSTSELLDMWTKIPSDFKTWVIGDGYFVSPYMTNPYWVGEHRWAYYMGTDVGYLRFIYYFGVIGLFSFVLFFIRCTKICVEIFPKERLLFVLLFFMTLIIWAKVATDLFLVFALFLSIGLLMEKERTKISY